MSAMSGLQAGHTLKGWVVLGERPARVCEDAPFHGGNV